MMLSPSSRRAWIEICYSSLLLGLVVVALLAEGVDRNKDVFNSLSSLNTSPSSRRAWIEIRNSPSKSKTSGSPSSRRAWIEMTTTPGLYRSLRVALLAEGVDRNFRGMFLRS